MSTGDQYTAHLRVEVSELSQVAQARREAIALARRGDFDEHQTGTVAVIASELCTNLVKHANQGEMLLRLVTGARGSGVELLALDHGPGMANVNRAFLDGHSTAGTSGNGLGAVARMATAFDVYSHPKKGTALVARVWKQSAGSTAHGEVQARETVGVICVPKLGEEVCGDGWLHEAGGERKLFAIADGLGHGPQAAAASGLAIRGLREHQTLSPADQLQRIHELLRPTRGAAMAVTELRRGVVNYAGVGNIAAVLIGPEGTRSLASYNGTVGHQIHRIQEFQYPAADALFLIMHSDGISTHWDLTQYPGLLSRDPTLIAGVLYRDFTRGRDDTTVLVARTHS